MMNRQSSFLKPWSIRTYRRALDNGTLARPSICEICKIKADEPLAGHHEDYSKPLDVIWCCRKCHAQFHSGNRTIKHSLSGFSTLLVKDIPDELLHEYKMMLHRQKKTIKREIVAYMERVVKRGDKG